MNLVQYTKFFSLSKNIFTPECFPVFFHAELFWQLMIYFGFLQSYGQNNKAPENIKERKTGYPDHQ